MSQVSFYHLQHQTVGVALAQLLEKALASGLRAVVRVSSKQMLDKLDKELWQTPIDGFLPHATPSDKSLEQQPIILTEAQDNPANASLLFVINDANFDGFADYERVFYVFDGGNELNVADARERWKSLKDDGVSPQYWQQGERGGWKLKSE